ncbi:MAG: hypothetical protein D6722_12665, partial [Bacteroidetes bacterium]
VIPPALTPQRAALNLLVTADLNLLLVAEGHTRLRDLQEQTTLWEGLNMAQPQAIWLGKVRSWRAFLPWNKA